MGQELTKQENGLQVPFTPNESKFIELALKRKVLLYEVHTAIKEIKNIIFISHQIINKVIDVDEATTMAALLYERMIDTYPTITLEELKLASLKGASGYYGEYFGLNVKTYLFFVSEYVLSDDYKKAINKYKEISKPKEETKKLTRKEWKDLIQSDYKIYVEGQKDLIVFTEKKYLLLVKLQVIPHVNGEVWQIWLNRGKTHLEFKKIIQSKKEQDKTLLSQVEHLAKSFESGEIEKSDFRKIVFAARKLRYFAYFDYCIRNNIDNIFEN